MNKLMWSVLKNSVKDGIDGATSKEQEEAYEAVMNVMNFMEAKYQFDKSNAKNSKGE